VHKRGGRLSAIRGTVPSPFNLPPACRFQPRCPYAWDLCREVPPDLYPTDHQGQLARCHLHTAQGQARRGPALADHRAKIEQGAAPGVPQ
jgi:hypothetical protein